LGIKEEIRKAKIGMEFDERVRSGSFLQVDQNVEFSESFSNSVEVLEINEALKRYDWLKKYMWRVIPKEKDDYTRIASEEFNGYFVRSFKGEKVEFPVETCLYMNSPEEVQKVHNIVIAEESSELHLVTGCTLSKRAKFGLHIGITEFFVKKGAKLSYTMIHSWRDDTRVMPRSGILVEKGGTYVSNYLNTSPVKELQTYPTAYLDDNAKASFNSIVFGYRSSIIDIGSRAYLRGEKSKVEMISKSIASGGEIIARGQIIGEGKGSKGHLECNGLMLKDGIIRTIPELEARRLDVELSHEAAIGKVAEEEIEYLMSRGLSEEESISTIVGGFLSFDIKGVPDYLKREINKAIEVGQMRLL